jgi:hypothetical protein
MTTLTVIDCNHHVESFTREEARGDNGQWSTGPVLTETPLRLSGDYTFFYTYPLRVEAKFTHLILPTDSVIDILLLAKHDYMEIYRAEDDAVGKTGNIPGMLNRSVSSGPYGIWGHHLSDLYFEGVEIDNEKKTVKFNIGS